MVRGATQIWNQPTRHFYNTREHQEMGMGLQNFVRFYLSFRINVWVCPFRALGRGSDSNIETVTTPLSVPAVNACRGLPLPEQIPSVVRWDATKRASHLQCCTQPRVFDYGVT
jgi:hypothetical protein